jgi:hypothetical protein
VSRAPSGLGYYPPIAMPTNKLWLEHTERAAWESVQALREKLKLAESRLRAMAPPVEGWERLLEALDAANEDLGLAKDYAAIVRRLVERVQAAEARVAAYEKVAARRTPSRR